MKEYTDSGCIAFVGAAFKRGLQKTTSKKEINRRVRFVNDGDMFKLWCSVTNQNPKRLKNLTLIRNHKFLKEL